jgi:glutamate racemase
MGSTPDSPIGVFDSGIGGLSVFKALRAELPRESFVYVSDSGHAPYGERDAAHVIARSHAIVSYLMEQHHIKALVVACNTATALAIDTLRQTWPDLPIVGVEPALKPAALQSQTRRIGVMATRGTLASPKFKALVDSLQASVEVVQHACDGLADAIEHGDDSRIESLCQQAIKAMGEFGSGSGQIDQLVLGCTHYPFAASQLQALLGPQVRLIESGEPVARQTRRLLEAHAALGNGPSQRIRLFATGHPEHLQAAARDWLQLEERVELLSI